ncbi:MAG: alpha/beta hydrolase, partial [Pseudomonadota bacterium]
TVRASHSEAWEGMMNLSPAEQAALDAGYNLRAAVPEHPAHLERYVSSSADFRARWPGHLDVPYGDSPRQVIDLFLPDVEHPPVLIFIHGGYWQMRDRKDFSFVAAPLVEAGAAVAMVGYDLAPNVGMDTIVGQVRSAIARLYGDADKLGFDRGRICVAGHSAGGHLAAMALATDWPAAFGLPADVIKGVCAISGVFDLEPIRLCYLNEVLRLDQDQALRNSPVRLRPQTNCPVALFVGERETTAFHEQSRGFAAALGDAGLSCELIMQSDVDHFTIILSMGEASSPSVRWICSQLRLQTSA